jgi:beta-phosphoglucomutase family hydrolase
VLFDLDGVLTDTASIHTRAWKQAFDGFLSRRYGPSFQPFTESDYLNYVDGKPRFEGVDSFLRSRGIELPRGAVSDAGGDDTVCAVGNLKNALVGEVIASGTLQPYPGSVRLLDHLVNMPVKLAVVTSSANAAAVLRATDLARYFRVVVDGQVALALGLRGKPHPDPFLEAASRVGVDPVEAVVIEDAVSGVAAGRAGGFGLVIGVARHGNAATLTAVGADLVVDDLGRLV